MKKGTILLALFVLLTVNVCGKSQTMDFKLYPDDMELRIQTGDDTVFLVCNQTCSYVLEYDTMTCNNFSQQVFGVHKAIDGLHDDCVAQEGNNLSIDYQQIQHEVNEERGLLQEWFRENYPMNYTVDYKKVQESVNAERGLLQEWMRDIFLPKVKEIQETEKKLESCKSQKSELDNQVDSFETEMKDKQRVLEDYRGENNRMKDRMFYYEIVLVLLFLWITDILPTVIERTGLLREHQG